MRFKILLSCLLIVAVVVTIPQAIVSLGPTDASTTTVTLTTIYPVGTGNCGVGSAVIPFTGPVHVEFQSESLSMDIYVVQNLAYIPCGVHLSAAEMTAYGGPCVFAESMVTKADFDLNLPESHYAVFIIAWNQTNINGATATIVMNGASGVSTEVSLTPVTYLPTSNTIAQSSSSQMVLTPTNSLQMPQQPQSITTQPTIDTPELVLAVVVIAAVALFLYSRWTKKTQEQTE